MRVLINKMGRQGTLLEIHFRNALCIKADTDNAKEIIRLNGIYDKIIENGDCCTIKQLSINGSDLMAAGVPKGRQIGEMLEKALDAVMREPEMNTKEKLFELLELKEDNI